METLAHGLPAAIERAFESSLDLSGRAPYASWVSGLIAIDHRIFPYRDFYSKLVSNLLLS